MVVSLLLECPFEMVFGRFNSASPNVHGCLIAGVRFMQGSGWLIGFFFWSSIAAKILLNISTVPLFELLDEVLNVFEMFEGLPGVLAAGEFLPLHFVLNKF